MMRIICHFYAQCLRTLQEYDSRERKIGWGSIYNTLRPTINKITHMKFENPKNSDEYFKKYFKALEEEITVGLRNLMEK